jgi:hypothetical protein
MRWLLFIAAVPGSGVLALLALRSVVRWVRQMRQDEEDAERAIRIQRQYDLPDSAVLPEPTGKPAVKVRPPTSPEITSNYKEEVRRG